MTEHTNNSANSTDLLAGVEAFDVSDLLENGGVTFERDGYIVRLSAEYDEHADASHYGRFVDRLEEGTIYHQDAARVRAGTEDYRTMRYFRPGITVAEHIRQNLDNGYTLREARTQALAHVREDHARASSFGDGWSYVIIDAEISRQGVPSVALASASCGGVEDDAGADHVREICDDVTHDALDQAADVLAALNDGPGPVGPMEYEVWIIDANGSEAGTIYGEPCRQWSTANILRDAGEAEYSAGGCVAEIWTDGRRVDHATGEILPPACARGERRGELTRYTLATVREYRPGQFGEESEHWVDAATPEDALAIFEARHGEPDFQSTVPRGGRLLLHIYRVKNGNNPYRLHVAVHPHGGPAARD